MAQLALYLILAMLRTLFASENNVPLPQTAESARKALVKTVADLKEQQMRILALQNKVNITSETLVGIRTSNETTLGDMALTLEQYQSIKKQLDKLEATLSKGGAKGRATSPDFTKIPQHKWTMPIQYTLAYVPDAEKRAAVQQSLDDIQTKSGGCITFKEASGVPSGPHLQFINDPSYHKKVCGTSPLGKQSNKNGVRIAPDCWKKRTLIHEVLHSLGFDHTQNRPDRDQYLSINWNNIDPAYQFAFAKWPNALQKQPTPYDYKSIMYYYATAFAKDGRIDAMTPLIDTEQNRKTMGFLQELSELDAEALKKIYCSAGGTAVTQNPAGSQSCQDTLKTCSDLRDVVCSQPRGSFYYDFAVKTCSETCQLCDNQSQSGGKSACKDEPKYSQYCASWIGNGDCSSQDISIKSRVHLLCPQSCNICK